MRPGINSAIALKAASLSALLGVILGVLLGLFTSSGAPVASEAPVFDSWQQRELDVESLSAVLSTSKHWLRGAQDEADTDEGNPEAQAALELEFDPRRPGLFRYLKLVAILRDPGLEAVMMIENMPASEEPLVLSSRDEIGLLRLRAGDMVSADWVVSDLTATRLEFTAESSGEVTVYELFDWAQ